jgi:hypothetical protein
MNDGNFQRGESALAGIAVELEVNLFPHKAPIPPHTPCLHPPPPTNPHTRPTFSPCTLPRRGNFPEEFGSKFLRVVIDETRKPDPGNVFHDNAR